MQGRVASGHSDALDAMNASAAALGASTAARQLTCYCCPCFSARPQTRICMQGRVVSQLPVALDIVSASATALYARLTCFCCPFCTSPRWHAGPGGVGPR
jgi:hypothetical protein